MSTMRFLLLLCGVVVFTLLNVSPALSLTCSADELKCKDGSKCYEKTEHCDGFGDCDDNSDEQDCSTTCADDEFMCDDMCFSLRSKCDLIADCFDGSDEENCEARCELASDFMCESDHHCINSLLKCDGEAQCADGSDERGCNYTGGVVPKTEAKSELPKIDATTVASRMDVVEDDNEEPEMSEMPTCADDEVDCYENGSLCVVNEKICDGVRDCPTGYDESDCGAYSYKDTDTLAQLWVANGHTITKVNVSTGKHETLNVGGSIGRIDYCHVGKKILWIDVADHVIKRMHIDGSGKETLINTNIDTPVALSYDWIHNALYWADSGLKRGDPKIEVMVLPHKHRHVLFKSPEVEKPRVLAVDPRPDQGYLYWGQSGNSACIYRSGLDGSGRRCIVVGEPSSYVDHPSGLTIDFLDNRLLWLDSHLFALMSIDLKTGEQTVVDQFRDTDTGLAGLAVFESYIYWGEGHAKAIYKIHRERKQETDSSAVQSVLNGLLSPHDLVIFHSQRQPQGDNYCGSKNGGCSHICLPTPSNSTSTPSSSRRHRCVCPNVGDFFKISSDNKTCLRDGAPKKTTGAGSSQPDVYSSASPVVSPARSSSLFVGVIGGIVTLVVCAVVGSVAV